MCGKSLWTDCADIPWNDVCGTWCTCYPLIWIPWGSPFLSRNICEYTDIKRDCWFIYLEKKSQLVFFTQCFGGYVWMKYCSLYLWFYCKYTSRAFRFIERKNMRTYFSKSIIYLTFWFPCSKTLAIHIDLYVFFVVAYMVFHEIVPLYSQIILSGSISAAAHKGRHICLVRIF